MGGNLRRWPSRVKRRGQGVDWAPRMKPLEQVLPVEERDRIRREATAKRGKHYSPWLHLAVTSCFGLGALALAASLLSGVRWWELTAAGAYLVFANASEWRIHRDILHKRTRGATVLYDRHTPEHHMIFITDDMAIRGTAEFGLVLIPAYGIVLIFAGLLPLFGVIWLVGQHNLAALFCMVSMGYVVSYEWLHLSFHLPPDSWLGSLGVVRLLRRHHAVHHDPRLMQRWNFNVVVPLWDLVRRTYVRDREAALGKAAVA
jgi:hypothetical protein